MCTGPLGPVEIFFYWPEAILDGSLLAGASGTLLASSPVELERKQQYQEQWGALSLWDQNFYNHLLLIIIYIINLTIHNSKVKVQHDRVFI